jgi:hypothetical protein
VPNKLAARIKRSTGTMYQRRVLAATTGWPRAVLMHMALPFVLFLISVIPNRNVST